MSNKLKKVMVITLAVIICFIGAFTSMDAIQASTKATKATKAFQKYLKSKQMKEEVFGEEYQYAYVDINNDKIPEMLVTGDGCYHAKLYAYVNGKVKIIGSPFSGNFKFYSKKGIYYSLTIHGGDFVEGYFKFDGKKMKCLASRRGSDYMNVITGDMKEEISEENPEKAFAPFLYEINEKSSTKTKYNNYVKKLITKQKEAKYTLKPIK